MFCLLAFAAFVVFAPAVLLPVLKDHCDLLAEERRIVDRITLLDQRLQRFRAMQDAFAHDVEVNERLAMLDLLREDAQAQRRGAQVEADDAAAFIDLARPLGLEPAAMRKVCLAHNLLAETDRKAFHGLVVAGSSLEELARDMGTSGVEIARRARRGLEAVLIAAGQMQRADGVPGEPELAEEAAAPAAGAAATRDVSSESGGNQP